MTHTTHTHSFIIVLILLTTSRAIAQSLTVINNTDCKLNYTLYGSAGSPCGEAYTVQATIAGNAIKKYTDPSSVAWPGHSTVYFWRAFALRYEGATVTGNCNGGPPFSGVVLIPSCNNDVEYAWNTEENGDITVTISPVIIPRYKTALKFDLETIQGGVKVIINPVMDISHYIDVSSDEKWMHKDVFRVRTNQKFITSVHPLNADYKGKMPLLATDKANLYNGYDPCIEMPVSGSGKMVAMNCFCGTDQLFNVVYDAAAAQVPMLYTVTEP